MAQHGGKREGAGRKPKADELKVKATIDNVVAFHDLIDKLRQKAFNDKDRDQIAAIKLLLEYRIGKPHQTVTQEVEVTQKLRPDWMDEGES